VKLPRLRLPFAFKIGVSASLLSVAGVALFAYLSYRQHARHLTATVVEGLAATVRNAAALFPAEEVMSRDPGVREVLRARLDLVSLRNPEVESFRLFALEGGNPLLIAAVPPGDPLSDRRSPSRPDERALEIALRDCIRAGRECVTTPHETGGVYWISAFTPITDTKGEVVGVLSGDRKAVELERLISAETRRMIYYSVAAIAASTALGVFLSLRVTRPLKRLYAATEAAARERFEPVDESGTDEVAALGRHFNRTHELLLRRMEELDALARELEDRVRERTDELSQSLEEARRTRDALLREMNVARQIQETIIPRGLQTEGITVGVEYLPVQDLGGDWGTVASRKSGLVELAVGDVTGHGLGAALVVNRVSTLLSQMCSAEADLKTLLGQLDFFLAEELSDIGIYMSLMVLRLDLEKMRLHYAGAGHPPVMVYRGDGSLTRLESNCGLLGLGELYCDGPMVSEFEIKGGDLIVLVTDGLIEAADSEGRQFGLEGLEKTILETSAEGCPAQELAACITEKVKSFTGGHLQDDVLIIVAKMT
jgi:serine phosphatase RsbU (regulator of sigma subunit)